MTISIVVLKKPFKPAWDVVRNEPHCSRNDAVLQTHHLLRAFLFLKSQVGMDFPGWAVRAVGL